VAELFDIITKCSLTGHAYADDNQVYIGTLASDHQDAMRRCADRITLVREWLARNRLRLNEEKTQVIWLGTRQQLNKFTVQDLKLSNTTAQFTDTVKDLGVTIDSQLTTTEHVNALSRSCFFQLRQHRTTRQYLTSDATKTPVHAFIGSRLDYCNSMFVGVSSHLLERLQRIQNASARLITDARKYDHISPVLRDLHWLPVRQRITLKIAVLVYQCLHAMAPQYLAVHCTPTSSSTGRSHLRSAQSGQLVVPRTRTR
jgi:hypothetical protein